MKVLLGDGGWYVQYMPQYPYKVNRVPVGSFDLGVSSRENGLFLRPCLEVHQMGSVRRCVVHGSRTRSPSTDLLQTLLVMRPEFGLRGV